MAASYQETVAPAHPIISPGAQLSNENYRTEEERALEEGVPKFTIASLWRKPQVNPLNQKSYSLPLLRFWDKYAVAFWFATLGFFVAFLSWFAFSPLTPETIKGDLHMTTEQVSNSNIVGLAATMVVRAVVGPMVDHFGPRKVMASLLVIGAIPSGLVPLVHSVGGLYAVRFFIGILGGTFVPCQAWMTAFVDTSIVGRANALAGGWGNAGGGVAFVTQTGLFQRLVKDGMKSHLAWRVCFVIIPVPLLLLTALGMMLFAQDHPLGKWSLRHSSPEAAKTIIVTPGSHPHGPVSEKKEWDEEKGAAEVKGLNYVSPVHMAVNEPFSFRVMVNVLTDPRTMMLALSYGSTFGFELAIDSGLADSLYSLFKGPNFKQLDAGYLGCTYGLLNICFRFFGGLSSDILYRRFGVQSKKWLLLSCAALQGLMALALGLLIDYGDHTKGSVMGLVVLCALFGFMANGANYSLVPHISSRSNGMMSGVVGAMGNAGGIVYTLIWRFQVSKTHGRPFWISGILCTGLNLLLMLIPLGDAW